MEIVGPIMPRSKGIKLVEVVWEDANVQHGWVGSDVQTAISITAGYLLEDNDRELIVASTMGTNTILCPVAIPKGCIVSTSVLRSKLMKGYVDERLQRLGGD